MSIDGFGSGVMRAVGGALELHEDEVPDLEVAAPSRSPRSHATCGQLRVGGRRRSRCTGRRGRSPPSPRSCPSRRSARSARRAGPRSAARARRPRRPARRPTRRGAPVGRPQTRGHQLPAERDRLGLEVVAEGEVAEHLEEGVVARAGSDVLEVVVLARDAQALLRRDGAPDVAASRAPVKKSLNWTMPALVKSSVASPCGTSGELGTGGGRARRSSRGSSGGCRALFIGYGALRESGRWGGPAGAGRSVVGGWRALAISEIVENAKIARRGEAPALEVAGERRPLGATGSRLPALRGVAGAARAPPRELGGDFRGDLARELHARARSATTRARPRPRRSRSRAALRGGQRLVVEVAEAASAARAPRRSRRARSHRGRAARRARREK